MWDVSRYVDEPRMELQEDCMQFSITQSYWCLTEGQTGSWWKRDWEYCGECVDAEKQIAIQVRSFVRQNTDIN